jgi:hypothetical protein
VAVDSEEPRSVATDAADARVTAGFFAVVDYGPS